LDLSLGQLQDHFDEIMSSGYSVSLFYRLDFEADQSSLGKKDGLLIGHYRSVAFGFFGAKSSHAQRRAPHHRHFLRENCTSNGCSWTVA